MNFMNTMAIKMEELSSPVLSNRSKSNQYLSDRKVFKSSEMSKNSKLNTQSDNVFKKLVSNSPPRLIDSPQNEIINITKVQPKLGKQAYNQPFNDFKNSGDLGRA